MQDTLLMIFAGILAVAVLIQSIVFISIYKSIRQLTNRMDSLSNDLLRNVEMVSEKVNEGLTIVRDIGEDLKPITSKIANTVDTIHSRVKEVDTFLTETTDTARTEITRIQDTINEASRRAQETIETLRNSILTPLGEINAITRAIRVVIDILFHRRRIPSNASVQDEEMFI